MREGGGVRGRRLLPETEFGPAAERTLIEVVVDLLHPAKVDGADSGGVHSFDASSESWLEYFRPSAVFFDCGVW